MGPETAVVHAARGGLRATRAGRGRAARAIGTPEADCCLFCPCRILVTIKSFHGPASRRDKLVLNYELDPRKSSEYEVDRMAWALEDELQCDDSDSD